MDGGELRGLLARGSRSIGANDVPLASLDQGRPISRPSTEPF